MMNLRIPLQVVDSQCVPDIAEAEEKQASGQRAPPPTVTLTPAVGQKLSVLPHWSQLPTADGGTALRIMKAALKLSHVLWQVQVPATRLEAERRKKMSNVVELDLPKKELTLAQKEAKYRDEKTAVAWTVLPAQARPFPWDGQELQPVAEQVGLSVRPIATFVDREEGNPIDGLPTSVGPSFTIGFSGKMMTTLKKIRREGRVGFHASGAENSDRYAVFVGFHNSQPSASGSGGGGEASNSESGSADDGNSDAASSSEIGAGSGGTLKRKPRGKLHFAAQLIPDSDAAPLQTVKEGVLGDAVGLMPVAVMSAHDEVGLTLHLQTSSSSSAEAEAENGATSAFRTAAPFHLCLRSRADRDLITAAILTLQGDSSDFTEALKLRLASEERPGRSEDPSEEGHRELFRRADYVVCRTQDALR